MKSGRFAYTPVEKRSDKEVFQKLPGKTFFMNPQSISMGFYHNRSHALYWEIEVLDDPLTYILVGIDFDRIRLTLSSLYENDTDKSGRHSYNPILIVMILQLKHWYNPSGPKIERYRVEVKVLRIPHYYFGEHTAQNFARVLDKDLTLYIPGSLMVSLHIASE